VNIVRPLKTLLAHAVLPGFLLCACGALPGEIVPVGRLSDVESAVISGIYKDPVTLEHGSYQGDPFDPGGVLRPEVRLLEQPGASGDIDGDGIEEQCVLLAESSGGSGTFIYLSVLRGDAFGFHSVATVLLGDRVKVTRMDFDGGTVAIEMLVHEDLDPLCCPSQPRTRRWAWVANELQPLD